VLRADIARHRSAVRAAAIARSNAKVPAGQPPRIYTLMRVVIVHNSTAGEKRYDRESLMRLIRTAGHDTAYFSSDDDAWTGAVDPFADVVAAAGGDGTVTKVAQALAVHAPRVPIVVLPLGTANNISRALGQAGIPFEDLVAGWVDARRQPFDTALARGRWGAVRFLESVGVGLLADGMGEAEEDGAGHIRQVRSADGRMAAARDLFHRRLGRMAATRMDVSLDGRDHSGEYLLVEVLTFGTAGPHLRLAPHAGPSDGLLHVVLVDEHHRRDLADHLTLGRSDSARPLPAYKGRHVKLSCTSRNLHLDGEVRTGRQTGHAPLVIDLTIEPKTLTFLAPPSRS